MGFTMDVSVPVLTVFLQGLISFFSPCVLPLIPLYVGYLSGGTAVRGEDGQMHYDRRKVFVNTLCFVLGVSFAFFLLGLGVSAVSSFFKSSQMLFARIGGILIVLFGLYQLGVFGRSAVLGKERRFSLDLSRFAMSPWVALLMGFTFSFAWTPCVGPALASVLLMAASSATKTQGFLLIGVYTLGFVLPFLGVGLFTTKLLGLFKKYMRVVQYTVKIGAVLMILMGLMMFTGKMNDVTGYLSSISLPDSQTATAADTAGETNSDSADETAADNSADAQKQEATEGAEADANAETAAGAAVTDESTGEKQADAEAQPETVAAPDFTLTDQYGNEHTLSDYKGKTVLLNFWATWCPPCRAEMPDLQRIYESYETEGEEALVVLGIAAPNVGNEKSAEEIAAFLEENGYTYPTLMDEGGMVNWQYGVSALPTTFMIDKDGNVFGYASGQLTEDIFHDIIAQTMEGR